MSIEKVLKRMKDENIGYVDLRFTDPKGKMQHVTFDSSMVDEDLFKDGTMFDDTGEAYNRDPRTTAKAAEKYMQSAKVGDQVYFGPEAEFFVFDDVRWNTDQQNTGYSFDSTEGPYNTGTQYTTGNMGHRPGPKGGYFPVMKFDTLVSMADNMQLYKYIVQNVAHAYGKTATFMPKPVWNDNGTGMHVHQSIWKDGKPLFAGNEYAGLSKQCLYYIGGIIKHAKAINAFANASTNSYKRLVPGFEAPVMLAYSARNRSASIRIPWTASPNGKRLEARFPDPAGNPYLTYTALLMAGLDGIKNKIDPGDPMDIDLYDLEPAEAAKIPQVCGSLKEALESLDGDRDFLNAGGVFDDDQIDAYIDLKMEVKMEEVHRVNMHPHPVEFDLYYKC